MLARLSGDEFAVLLPKAVRGVPRVVARAGRPDAPHGGGAGEPDRRVTASFGVASSTDRGGDRRGLWSTPPCTPPRNGTRPLRRLRRRRPAPAESGPGRGWPERIPARSTRPLHPATPSRSSSSESRHLAVRAARCGCATTTARSAAERVPARSPSASAWSRRSTAGSSAGRRLIAEHAAPGATALEVNLSGRSIGDPGRRGDRGRAARAGDRSRRADLRGHRDGRGGQHGRRPARSATGCPRWAAASPWTTSAPASAPSTT